MLAAGHLGAAFSIDGSQNVLVAVVAVVAKHSRQLPKPVAGAHPQVSVLVAPSCSVLRSECNTYVTEKTETMQVAPAGSMLYGQ